jgi:pyruvate formate lyase activating enzyme
VCGDCVQECYSGALELAGKWVKVKDVINEVLKDQIFYKNSGGGMTVSGGEPLAQPLFTKALFDQAKSFGVHTAIDTSGYAPWDTLKKILESVDLVLYDLKHMDSEIHKQLTGVSNELIIENLRKIDETSKPVWVRIPLIPVLNSDESHFVQIGELLTELNNIERVDILRYHRLAESKYEQVGLTYKLKGLETPEKEEAELLGDVIRSYGLKVNVS